MTQNDQNPLQQYYQYDGNAPNYQTNNFASVENTPQNVNPQNFDYNKNAYANPVSMGHPNLYSEGIQQQHNSMPQYVQNENYFNEYSNINQTNNSSQIRNDFQTFPSSKQEPKNSPSKIINDSKALNEPSNQIDYLQVPNFPDQENSYVQSKTNNQIIGYTTGPECDIIQSPKIFQDFVGIDKGFSTHKFCRLSFPNWAKNLISKQSFSSSDLPLIFSITPFAELSKRENKVPVIDRKKSGPMRCSRCFAYVCPGSKINTLEGSLKCALCNENSIVPSEISIASNSSNELGLGVELSHGTYDMEVGESFLPKNSCQMKQPVFVFLVEASSGSVVKDIFKNVIMSIKKFIKEESDLENGQCIPFLLCTYSSSINIFSFQPSSNHFFSTTIFESSSFEIPIEDILLDKLKLGNNLDFFFDHLVNVVDDQPKKPHQPLFDKALETVLDILKNDGRNSRCFIFQHSPLPKPVASKSSNQSDLKNVNSNVINANAVKSAIQSLNISSFSSENKCSKLIRMCSRDFSSVVDLIILTEPVLTNLMCFEPLCLKTGGNAHIYYDLKDYSVLIDLLNQAKTSVFDVRFTIRTGLGLQCGELFGPISAQDDNVYSLNGADSRVSFNMELFGEEKSFKSNQNDIIVQPAYIFTNMYGKRIIRVLNSKVFMNNRADTIFNYSDQYVIADYYFKKYANEIYKKSQSIDVASKNCIRNISKIFEAYCTNTIPQDVSHSDRKSLRMPSQLATLPSVISAIFSSFGVNISLSPNIELYHETFINLNRADIYTNFYLLYPLIYCYNDIANESHFTSLPQRLRALYTKMNHSKIYFVCNGKKTIVAIGESVDLPLLHAIFSDPDLCKPVQDSIDVDICVRKDTVQGKNFYKLYKMMEKKVKQRSQILVTYFPSSSKSFLLRMFEDSSLYSSSKCVLSIHNAFRS